MNSRIIQAIFKVFVYVSREGILFFTKIHMQGTLFYFILYKFFFTLKQYYSAETPHNYVGWSSSLHLYKT